VSLSRDSFTRALSLWTTPGREREQPYFGWMSTELPQYQPSTLALKTRVHTQAVGQRPPFARHAAATPIGQPALPLGRALDQVPIAGAPGVDNSLLAQSHRGSFRRSQELELSSG
jgi:uncharacterized protein DUF2199